MPDLRIETRDLRYDDPGTGIAGSAASHEKRRGADLSFDLTRGHGQFTLDNGLRSAVYLSLFCDALAADSDPLPDAEDSGPFPDRRGYWADFLSPVPGDRYGSRLYLLRGRALNQQTLALARTYALEALRWLETLGIGTPEVEASSPRREVLELVVVIRDQVGRAEKRYRYVWDAMESEGV